MVISGAKLNARCQSDLVVASSLGFRLSRPCFHSAFNFDPCERLWYMAYIDVV